MTKAFQALLDNPTEKIQVRGDETLNIAPSSDTAGKIARGIEGKGIGATTYETQFKGLGLTIREDAHFDDSVGAMVINSIFLNKADSGQRRTFLHEALHDSPFMSAWGYFPKEHQHPFNDAVDFFLRSHGL